MEFRQLVGRTDDGGRIIVRVRIQTMPGEHETTEHGTVTDPERLSVTGEYFDARRRNPSSVGQIRDMLAGVTVPARGWSLDEVRELGAVWERWHLNDMRAACAHQTVVWEESDYGRRPSLELTEPCPVTGYRYGRAWLADPVPADVLARVRYLMRER